MFRVKGAIIAGILLVSIISANKFVRGRRKAIAGTLL
jgi:hypothetical protein